MESQIVNIEFTPNIIGEITDDLNILTNDPVNNPFSYSVSGSGVSPVINSPQELGVDCGSVYLTDTSDNFLIEIQNTGTMDLTINSVSFTEGTNLFNYEYSAFRNPVFLF